MRNIAIIGNGISGITCARNIRKMSDDNITVISAETDHFFSRTALMYIFMGHMKYEHTKPYEDFFWKKNRINLIRKYVKTIDVDVKKLMLDGGDEISYDVLVIATGSVTQKFNWPGQDLKGVTGLYTFQDLELMQQQTKGIKHAVITGGGLIGIEMAEMLHSKKIGVTMLVKDKYYWAGVLPEQDASLINNQIKKNGIDILYNVELKEITGDENGNIQNVITSDGKKIDCQFAGIATGVKPNILFLQPSGIEVKKGILINEYFETNIKNIYAIGDCAEFKEPIEGRKKIEQIWYTGRMHGETVARTICGKRTAYRPGPWFNSAKFFDLEYQTYGIVTPACKKDEKYFFWKHPKKEIAFGALYNMQDSILIGVNCYGMRLKHTLFDQWIKEKRSVDFVLSHLHKAMFNPEFAKDYSDAIIDDFNGNGGKVKKQNSLKSFFNFKSSA